RLSGGPAGRASAVGARPRPARRERPSGDRDAPRRRRTSPGGDRWPARRRPAQSRAQPRGDLPLVLLRADAARVMLLRLALRLGRVGAIAVGAIGVDDALAQAHALASIGSTPP